MHFAAALTCTPLPRSVWSDVIQPKEHGSWSLALEPVLLGLCAAPSGSGWFFAGAVASGFLLRRPLKIAFTDRSSERRTRALRVSVALATFATTALFAVATTSAQPIWPWLIVPVLLGAIFLREDFSQHGREAHAEVFGAAAFASVPAVIGVAAGATCESALGLAGVMAARSIPTVWLIRRIIRGNKSGTFSAWAALWPSAAFGLAAAGITVAGHLQLVATVVIAALLGRAAIYTGTPLRLMRARTLGLCEMGIGIVVVSVLGAVWRV